MLLLSICYNAYNAQIIFLNSLGECSVATVYMALLNYKVVKYLYETLISKELNDLLLMFETQI